MDLEDREFLEFAKFANEENLKYIIIDGFAMNLHSMDRHTNDIDLWVEPTNENKESLLKVFVKFGYSTSELIEIEGMDFTDYLSFTAFGFLDVLTIVHKSLNYYECEKMSNHQILANNATCNFLHINHLRESIILSSRHKDLRDIILIDDYIKTKN